MRRMGGVIAVLSTALAVGACGGSQPSKPPPSPAKAVAVTSDSLARDAKALQLEITGIGTRMVQKSSERKNASVELDKAEGEARQLLGKIQANLAPDDPSRDSLSVATDAIANAAAGLRVYSGSNDKTGLQRAREALKESQTQFGDFADQLETRLPPEQKRQAADFRQKPRVIPNP